MKFSPRHVIAALVASILMMPLSSEAAGTQLRVRFSYDLIANCEHPHLRNFHVHGEGTGELSVDRSASIEVASNVDQKTRYNATLGGAPVAVPAGSLAVRVVGRHTIRIRRDYPNNVALVDLVVRGNNCTMTIEHRLKPGKRQYTFPNGSDLAYCDRPQTVGYECAPTN